MKETILYGYPNSDLNKFEEILYRCYGYVNLEELKQRSIDWAKENDYTLLRIDIISMNEIETITF